MRYGIVCVLVIFLLPAGLLGCMNAGEFAALNTNRLIWEALDVYHYRYQLQVSCFCVPQLTTPVVVEVQNGVPVSVEYATKGDPPPPEYFDRYDTIDELFLVIEDAIGQQPVILEAMYDNDYGFPIDVYIDYEANVADEELGFSVTDFEDLSQ
jgi:hypothetical protein